MKNNELLFGPSESARSRGLFNTNGFYKVLIGAINYNYLKAYTATTATCASGRKPEDLNKMLLDLYNSAPEGEFVMWDGATHDAS